jgi:hypothetical protein
MTNDVDACRKILLALKVRLGSRPMRSNVPAGDDNNDQAVHRQRNSNLFATKPADSCINSAENLDDDLQRGALFV